MKLLVDAHCFDRKVSEGLNTFIEGIYTRMPRLASDINFFFASSHGDNLSHIFGEAPNIRYIRTKSNNRAERLLYELPRTINKYNIDIAHFQYATPPVKNCRTIVTIHDLLFLDFPKLFTHSYRIGRNILFRRSARNADILTTVSEYSRQRISSHFDIDPAEISVTPNAVKDEFFSIDRAQAKKEIYSRGIRPYLLNVSRIEPRKNQLGLVRAYHELGLADRGYDLVLINNPAIQVTDLDRYINSLPVDVCSHIHRIDGLPHNRLKNWYAAASLFVFPSLAEGFGIPPLEAAATGTPTICHNQTAMADFSFLGSNLADLSDNQKLKDLIISNLESPPSEEEMKKTAEKIKQTYNWTASAGILLNKLRPH